MTSRYTRTARLDAGKQFGTSNTITQIRNAINSGAIPATTSVLGEGQRLDTLAGQIYGDSRLWWVIAAASGIGFGLQVPAGTRLVIPTNIEDVQTIVG
jgi:hypothetical protein